MADLRDYWFTYGSNTALSEIQSGIESFGLFQSDYNFNSRVFPEDLATDYNGHYMVININVPVKGTGSGAVKRTGLDDIPGLTGTLAGTGDYSKVDKLRFGTYGLPGRPKIKPTNTLLGGNAILNSLGANTILSDGVSELGNIALLSGTRRIVESIAIHMPTPVLYNSQHLYEEVSLTSIGGNIGKLLTSGGVGAIAGLITRSFNASQRNAGRGRALYDSVRGVIGTVGSLTGNPINPRVEVLFTNTPQRQFNFEFLMAPKSENESKVMKSIIEVLRFHAAPELSSLGFIPTFIPPAQFDISFFNKGSENLNIPRINTCVMERIEVDYAPTGMYSTFRNGHPVAARLSMSFRELEILHKARITQGF